MPPKNMRRRSPNAPGSRISMPSTNDPSSTSSSSAPRPQRPPRRQNLAHAEVAHKTAEEADTEEHAGSICSICAERVQDWAVGHCPHVVCGDCSHRMRVLYDRKTCVMCNAELRQVAVVPLRHYRPDMDFEQAVALPGAFQDKQVEMWFVDRVRHQQLKNVRGWKCSHKQCIGKGVQESLFANATQLRAHARSEHRAIYCEICFTGRKCFVSEMQLYTMDADRNYSSRLRGHLRKEHPQCRFCRHYYLDDEKLYAHLQETHETCFICERNGRMHEYYVNYEQLENHYRKEHYVCRDEGCRGVVFATQIELQTHEHTRHNDNPRSARARALRVNLQQLHGERDPRRRNVGSPRDVRIEQERQAARRQAFLSSNVVFSGALNYDDAPVPSASDGAPCSSQPYSSSEARASTPGASAPIVTRRVPAEVRRPDDGHFHPLALPRDGEELASRNTILVRTMRSLLDPAAYEQFRMSSGQFHSGKISADEYYDAVTDAFGVRTAVRDILPELVALLPTLLLREPLLQTCLRRTTTKPSSVGYGSQSGTVAGSSSAPVSGTGQEEQFPTLSGAPVPVRAVPQTMRRFGSPGPEEFPRLGRVNKAQGKLASPSSSQSSSSASMSLSRPAPSPRPETTQPQKTAASVLRQTPLSHRLMSQQRVAPMAGSSNVGTGAQLSANAFPALSSVASSSQSSVAAEQEGPSWTSSNSSTSDAPDPDVSMRVGAVWGGVAGSARNRGGKKRGPGRGQGRQPASPPKRAVLGTGDFPDIRAGAQSDNATSSDEQSSQGSVRKPAVINVMEIARARRNAVQKSSLPKVGGSGYGFAWDRKKVQQKKKQIKNSVGQTGINKPKASSESFVPTSFAIAETTNTTNNNEPDEKATLAEGIEEIAIGRGDAGDKEVQSAPEELGVFDPFSYLKKDAEDDDPVASFFGTAK